ncbi:MAG: collagen-like protein, partial [Thermoproteota archaeon]
MSSRPRLEVQGQSPFKQSGIYEVQIFIADSMPHVDKIRNKQFSSLWKGHFHLRVKDGIFTETLGSDENPIPSSVYDLDTVWIVVTDLFSSLHSVFDVSLRKPSKETKHETRTEIESPKPQRTAKPTSDFFTATGYAGPQGSKGPSGPQGVSGDKGPLGDKGPQGIQGPQGDKGPSGPQGVSG